jgi:ActR/RegA family two-component response regulator
MKSRTLLLTPDTAHAMRLTKALVSHGYHVTVRPLGLEQWNLKRFINGFDAVVVDLSFNRQSDWQMLSHICQLRQIGMKALGVLAVSRKPHNPGLQLKAERYGARWVSL